MTEQEPELIIDGKDHFSITETPLEQFFTNHTRPALTLFKTSNRRGYIGTWMISDNNLLLIDLKADPKENKGFIIDDLFKEKPPIKALWFSGKLSKRLGKIIRYDGFTPIHEKIEEIEINKGSLISRKTKFYNEKMKKYI